MERRAVTRLESSYLQQYDVYIDRQQRKKKRLIRRLVLFLFITLLTFGSLSAYHVKQRSVYAEKQEQYEQLEEQLVTLKQQELDLIEEIALLNDEEYVLEIARTNYFFSKEGELIFKIIDEDPTY